MATPEVRSREGLLHLLRFYPSLSLSLSLFLSLSLCLFLPRNMIFCPLLDSICLVPSRTGNPIYYIRVHTSVSRFYRDIDIGQRAEAKGGLSPKPSSQGMPRINRLVSLDTHSLRLLITMRPVVFTFGGPKPFHVDSLRFPRDNGHVELPDRKENERNKGRGMSKNKVFPLHLFGVGPEFAHSRTLVIKFH